MRRPDWQRGARLAGEPRREGPQPIAEFLAGCGFLAGHAQGIRSRRPIGRSPLSAGRRGTKSGRAVACKEASGDAGPGSWAKPGSLAGPEPKVTPAKTDSLLTGQRGMRISARNSGRRRLKLRRAAVHPCRRIARGTPTHRPRGCRPSVHGACAHPGQAEVLPTMYVLPAIRHLCVAQPTGAALPARGTPDGWGRPVRGRCVGRHAESRRGCTLKGNCHVQSCCEHLLSGIEHVKNINGPPSTATFGKKLT